LCTAPQPSSGLSLPAALPLYGRPVSWRREVAGERPLTWTREEGGARLRVESEELFELFWRAVSREPLRLAPRLPPGPRELPECRSEEHTSELQSRENLVCRLL